MGNLADDNWRPYVGSENRSGQPIRAGAGTTPYFNGMLAAATNFNHHLAYFRRPVVDQHGSAVIAYTSGTITWANYVVRVPRLLCRTAITFKVTGSASAGTFDVGITPQGGTTTWSSSIASGTATVNCSTSMSFDEYIVIDLSFRMSVAANFTVTDVFAYLTPLTAGGIDIGTIESLSGSAQGAYTPQATAAGSQYALDCPLTVAMVGDLLRGNDRLFRDCVGPVVNWSYWGNRSTVPTAGVGLSQTEFGAGSSNNITAPATFAQYIYIPRAGVRRFKLFAAARLHGYVTNEGKLTLGWRGASAPDAVDVATATTVFTEGSWVIWGGDLTVPQGVGPYYLDVRGMASSEGSLFVQGLAVYEDVETVA